LLLSLNYHRLAGKENQTSMEKIKAIKAAVRADLMVVDKSYPLFSELLRNDDWKIIYHDNKASGLFVPVEMRDRRIELVGGLPELESEFSPELIEIF
jgi:hypothetical protein